MEKHDKPTAPPTSAERIEKLQRIEQVCVIVLAKKIKINGQVDKGYDITVRFLFLDYQV